MAGLIGVRAKNSCTQVPLKVHAVLSDRVTLDSFDRAVREVLQPNCRAGRVRVDEHSIPTGRSDSRSRADIIDVRDRTIAQVQLYPNINRKTS